jgi:uncharacterized protein (TIGR02266 family)
MSVAITDGGRFVREGVGRRSRLGRVDLEVPVQLSSDQGGSLQGVLRNLSIGGMFVATARLLPSGTRVVARFSSGEGIEPDEIEAEVSWVRRAVTDEGAPAGMGLRFVGSLVRAAVFVRVLLRARPPSWG